MKLVIAALLTSSAAAFGTFKNKGAAAGPQNVTASSGYENALGVIEPTGFWDPCGLSRNIDQETFDQYRLAELKHGRVAQLACVGYVTQETYRFDFDLVPGEVSTSDIPNGLAAVTAIPFLGWAQIIAFVGTVETYGWFTSPTGVIDLPDDILAKRQTAELQHGRVAMLAVLELLRHDAQTLAGLDQGYPHLITGLPFIYDN
jgi:hypothetical protein